MKQRISILGIILITLLNIPLTKVIADCRSFLPQQGGCPFGYSLYPDTQQCCTADSAPSREPAALCVPLISQEGGCRQGTAHCPGTQTCCPPDVSCPAPPPTLPAGCRGLILQEGGCRGEDVQCTGTDICCDSSDLCEDVISQRTINLSGSTFNLFCDDTKTSITTAIGCIPTNPTELIGVLLRIGTGIGGGIAFLLILFGGFQVITSTGNPEKLNAGKELVGSAITGLLLILFSVFILRIIGVNILGIPGFG